MNQIELKADTCNWRLKASARKSRLVLILSKWSKQLKQTRTENSWENCSKSWFSLAASHKHACKHKHNPKINGQIVTSNSHVVLSCIFWFEIVGYGVSVARTMCHDRKSLRAGMRITIGDFGQVSCKQIQRHERGRGWARNGMKVIRCHVNSPLKIKLTEKPICQQESTQIPR